MAVFRVTNALDSGKGSLRQAINDANLTAEPDIIEFDSSVIGKVIKLTSGQLTITNPMRVKGLGAKLLTVDAGQRNYRVFNIDDGTAKLIDVSISGLTITGGISAKGGGGIRSLENLTVHNSIISGNKIVATQTGVEENLDGGGIYSRSGILTVTKSIIASNNIEGEKKSGEFNGDDLDGGGIATWEGQLIVNDSIISGNVVSAGLGEGGGIYTWKSQMRVSNSTISGNTVDASAFACGGGIASYYNSNESSSKKFVIGSSTISGSTITDNSIVVDHPLNADGGGIFIDRGTLLVSESTISGNKVFQLDGKAGSNDGGGIYARNSLLTVINSTISGNSASRGGGGIAAGTTDLNGMVTVSNSTLSGNSASFRGGGIYVRSGKTTIKINNSTISTNSASEGSGIYTIGSASLASNIIADNVNNLDVVGSFTSHGNNLIGNGEGSVGLIDGVNGDIVGTSAHAIAPLLSPLQDNGGFLTGASGSQTSILTHALLSGSSAINAGSNPDSLIYDQRGMGFSRQVGSSTDMGAYEIQENVVTLPVTAVLVAAGLIGFLKVSWFG